MTLELRPSYSLCVFCYRWQINIQAFSDLFVSSRSMMINVRPCKRIHLSNNGWRLFIFFSKLHLVWRFFYWYFTFAPQGMSQFWTGSMQWCGLWRVQIGIMSERVLSNVYRPISTVYGKVRAFYAFRPYFIICFFGDSWIFVIGNSWF